MRRLLVNLTLSLVVSVLLLAALEGVALLVDESRPPERPVAEYIWDWDDKMPGGFYVMRSEAVGWPPWQEFNGDGLRDRTRPHEKPDGVWRVAVLGDSVTLGDGLKAYEAYPQVLEGRLAAAGERIEVMNVALWGWSTRQERIAWQRIAREYHPDQVVLAVCLNDIPELHNNLSRPPGWLVWLHERSALVRLLVGAEGREIQDVEALFADPDAPRVRQALDRFFEEIRDLREEVEAGGATLAVVVFPFRFQLEEGAPRPVVQERMASFCDSEGLECLDLLPTLGRMGPAAFLDYDHLSRGGAVLTAETILASGLLPQGHSNAGALKSHLEGTGVPGGRAVLEWLNDRGRPLPESGLRQLVALLEAEHAEVRSGAVWALRTQETLGTEALRRLVERVGSDPDSGVRAAAVRALGTREDADRSVVHALFEALNDPHEGVRHEAARALSRLLLTVDDIPRLVRAIESPDAYVRAFAAWRLGNFGEAARGAVPALAAALEDPEMHVAVSAALARIGPGASAAVPALIEQCSAADASRRWRAAKALGRIGPAAAEAVPALATALEDPNARVRQHAARALGRIGEGGGPDAARALQQATGDPDGTVSGEAERALETLRRGASGPRPENPAQGNKETEP